MPTNLLHPKITDYLLSLMPAPPKIFQEMEQLAQKRRFPVIGPLEGRLLYFLTKTSGAKRIFEFGSGFGYSALWFAMATPEDGQIICTEYDSANATLGRNFMDQAGYGSKVVFEVGDALQTIKNCEGPFDLIFCDMDKNLYPQALEKGLPKLKSGGLFIADNT